MNFNEYVERRNTESLKWDGYRDFYPVEPGEELLPMWIADMDFRCPQPVIDALEAKVKEGIFGYPLTDPDGFKEAIVSWVKRRYGLNIHRDEAVFTRGVMPGYNVAMQVFTQPGDGILIQRPVYAPYTDSILDNGRKVIDSPLVAKDGHFEIDFDDFEEKASRRETKMMMMSNPHNPVGKVYTYDELKRIGEICVANNVLIVSDEVHADLIMKGYKHIPIATISPEIAANTLTAYAPSKTFNLAGLHTSYFVITNPYLRKEFMRQQERNRIWDINCFGSVALQAAYTKCDGWLEECLEYIEGNIDYMEQFIKKEIPKAKMYRPEGTYLVWVDFSGTGMTEQEFEYAMFHEAKVAIELGIGFGGNAECCARINVACTRDLLKEALERIKKAFV